MFILKRREDGLYFRNQSYHSRVSRRHELSKLLNIPYGDVPKDMIFWTADFKECKPFKSIRGAKSAHGIRRVLYDLATRTYQKVDDFYKYEPIEVEMQLVIKEI